MAAFSTVRDERGLHVRFDDGRMNLLSAANLAQLREVVAAVPADAPLFTFRSARSHIFAAGADMEEMSKFGASDADRFSRLGQEVFASIERLPMPTVVLIDGDCFGGALDLTLAFDLRIATRASRFAHPGARIGIVTGFAGTVRLPHLLSRHDVVRMMLTNAPVSAAEAERSGLVDLVIEDLDGSENEALDRVASTDRASFLVARELSMRSNRLPLSSLQSLARRLHDLYSENSAWMS